MSVYGKSKLAGKQFVRDLHFKIFYRQDFLGVRKVWKKLTQNREISTEPG